MSDDNLYIPIESLGTGGQAKVDLVIHKTLGHKRALRRISEYVDENGRLTPIHIKNKKDPIYEKFENECKTLLRLGNGSHPNILRIAQPILYRGTPAVEMDLLTGKDVFRDLGIKGCYSIKEIIKLLHDISSALAYCHYDIVEFCINPTVDDVDVEYREGKSIPKDETSHKRLIKKYKVVHNDIQAKNVFLTTRGDFILIDFGLSFDAGNGRRTSHGAGVEMYKAPEKFDVSEFEPTEQSDIYSFGVLLYECLTGDGPFPDIKNPSQKEATELQDKRKRVNNEPIPDIWENRKNTLLKKNENTIEKDIPEWLEKIILKCLEPDPKNRFQNGRQLYDKVLEELEKIEKERISSVKKVDYKDEIRDYETKLKNTNNEIEVINENLFKHEEEAKKLTKEKLESLDSLKKLKEENRQAISEKDKEISILKIKQDELRRQMERLEIALNQKEVILKKTQTELAEGKKILIEKESKLVETEKELEKEKKNVKVVLSDKLTTKYKRTLVLTTFFSILFSGVITWFYMDVKATEYDDEIRAHFFPRIRSLETLNDSLSQELSKFTTSMSTPVDNELSKEKAFAIINEFKKDLQSGSIPDEDLIQTREIIQKYPELRKEIRNVFENQAKKEQEVVGKSEIWELLKKIDQL